MKQIFSYRKIGKRLVALTIATISFGVSQVGSADELSVPEVNDSTVQENVETSANLQEVELEIASTIQEIDVVESELSVVNSELQEVPVEEMSTQKLEEDITSLMDEVSSLETELSDTNNELASLVQDINSLETEISSLDEQLATPVMVSHRGYNTVAPEESEVAYVKAVEDGFTHLEADIYFTLDGVPVLHHDNTINRLARTVEGNELSETVKISETTFDELNQYDYGIYKGAEYAGTKLLTFEEFIKLSSELGVEMIHAEYKQRFSKAQKQFLYDIVKQYGMENKVGWQSFSWSDFDDLNEIAPGAQIELLGSPESSEAMLVALNNYDNGLRNVVASVWTGTSNEVLQDFLNNGHEVYVWTVNTEEAISKYHNLGVSAIMTNGSRSLENVLKSEVKSQRDDLVSNQTSKKNQAIDLQKQIDSLTNLIVKKNQELSEKNELLADLTISQETKNQLLTRQSELLLTKNRLEERLTELTTLKSLLSVVEEAVSQDVQETEDNTKAEEDRFEEEPSEVFFEDDSESVDSEDISENGVSDLEKVLSELSVSEGKASSTKNLSQEQKFSFLAHSKEVQSQKESIVLDSKVEEKVNELLERATVRTLSSVDNQTSELPKTGSEQGSIYQVLLGMMMLIGAVKIKNKLEEK